MGGGCYKISDERMGWIEAKKMCEATNSQLLSFQSPEEAESLISFIRRIQVFFGHFLVYLFGLLGVFWPFWRLFWPTEYILFYLFQPRRTRFEFWTAGNDIDKENEWIWSGPSREPVAGKYLLYSELK